jgi:hypothetical protein
MFWMLSATQLSVEEEYTYFIETAIRRFSQNCEKRPLALSYLYAFPSVPLDGFSLNYVYEYFSKICHKIQVSLKRD